MSVPNEPIVRHNRHHRSTDLRRILIVFPQTNPSAIRIPTSQPARSVTPHRIARLGA